MSGLSPSPRRHREERLRRGRHREEHLRRGDPGGQSDDPSPHGPASPCRKSQADTHDLRLHYGCGATILPGWVNIDTFPREGADCVLLDIADLPFGNATVAEILAEHILEHLDFHAERRVWAEMARVLRPGGTLTLEVPDFAWVCQSFLAAEDDFRDFYRVGHADHYAGCGRDLAQRWGILQTMFFGNQNGAGQYHRSAYTGGKLRALAKKLGFVSIQIESRFNKGGQALRATLTR